MSTGVVAYLDLIVVTFALFNAFFLFIIIYSHTHTHNTYICICTFFLKLFL